MKVLSWNCNGAFRKKYHTLENIDADFLIIQECENPSQSTKAYQEWAGDYLWHGENKNKGLGVFIRSNIQVKKLSWDDDNLQSFLPCRVNNAFNLLAVWTKYANSPNFRYIGQLWKYVQLHKDNMAKEDLLLCGDLNSNTCWDEWDRWWNHSDVVKELEEIGIFSIYHRYYKEEQGKESRPTLFHQRKLEKPYHVDYAFSSNNLFRENENYLNVGDSNKWLEFSDHMPLILTIAY